MNDDTVFIGIGFGGCKILSKVEENVQKVYIDTDKSVQSNYSGIRIGENTCGEHSSCGDAILGEASAVESKEDILQAIKGFKYWVIISPFGGGTSCGATKKIIEFGNDLNKTVLVLTSMPLDLESNRRQRLAIDTQIRIQMLCTVVNLDFKKIEKKKLTINELFDIRDTRFLEEIEKILSV